MIHDKTYLRYQVLPLNKQLKGGSKNYDIFDKTPNFGSEKSFQLKSKIRNFDDLNQDYNKNYDIYSKVSRNKITNTNINLIYPIYPQYNLLLPKINVTFKRPENNSDDVSSSIILTEEQKEIKNLTQELIILDREIERLKGDEHESIVERLQKESQKQTGGAKKPIKKTNSLTEYENFLYKKLEKDWKIYLNKTKNPISKEKFTKEWWKDIKYNKLVFGTGVGAIAGAFGGIGAHQLSLFSLLGAFTSAGLGAVAALPVIGLAGVGLVISYLRYKYQKKKVNSVEKVKKLLKEEIEKRKKEIAKLKQLKNK